VKARPPKPPVFKISREHHAFLRACEQLDAELDHHCRVLAGLMETATANRDKWYLPPKRKHQAGNLAHGLKTPLAILANAADGLGAGEASQTVRMQAVAIRRQVDHALSRTRAAAAAGVPGIHCDAAHRVSEVLRAVQSLYRERHLDLATTTAAPIEVAVEIQDLDEMLGNLLDNACRHARKTIRAAAIREGARCQITIEDDGPGMADSAAQEILHGALTLDRSRDGSGLGLGIVRDLARAYRGELGLDRSRLGGLAATLVLPVAPTVVDNTETRGRC
jgi:signal transduction histidine kinase